MRKALFIVMLGMAGGGALAAPPTIDQLVASLPGDSTAVVAVDAAALRSHPTIQSWLFEHSSPWSGVDDEALAFMAESGLDPIRDVDLMVFSVSHGNGEKGAPFALFAGRFDPTSLGAALVKHGAERVTVAGTGVYRLDGDHGSDHHHPAMLHATGDLVMIGDAAALERALGASGAGSGMIREAIAAEQLDVGAPFWMVVTIPQEASQAAGKVHIQGDDPEVQAMEGLLKATASVRRVAMYARLSDRLEIRSAAVATTEENAELLRDAVKGVLAAARLQMQQQRPELVDVLRQVAVRLDGTTVRIAGTVSVQLLEEMTRGRGSHLHGSKAD